MKLYNGIHKISLNTISRYICRSKDIFNVDKVLNYIINNDHNPKNRDKLDDIFIIFHKKKSN